MVLRLIFHDAATFNVAARDGGANASLRLELGRPENFGLKRGWRVIEAAMAGQHVISPCLSLTQTALEENNG